MLEKYNYLSAHFIELVARKLQKKIFNNEKYLRYKKIYHSRVNQSTGKFLFSLRFNFFSTIFIRINKKKKKAEKLTTKW